MAASASSITPFCLGAGVQWLPPGFTVDPFSRPSKPGTLVSLGHMNRRPSPVVVGGRVGCPGITRGTPTQEPWTTRPLSWDQNGGGSARQTDGKGREQLFWQREQHEQGSKAEKARAFGTAAGTRRRGRAAAQGGAEGGVRTARPWVVASYLLRGCGRASRERCDERVQRGHARWSGARTPGPHSPWLCQWRRRRRHLCLTCKVGRWPELSHRPVVTAVKLSVWMWI